MKAILFAILLMAKLSDAHAGDAENIHACVETAERYAKVQLNEFDADYKGNWIAMSTAKWPNANCEVKMGEVYNLTANGESVVYERFAGKESYDQYQALRDKTRSAINVLNARIELLKDRLEVVEDKLKLPSPPSDSLSQYIADGLSAALGKPGGSDD